MSQILELSSSFPTTIVLGAVLSERLSEVIETSPGAGERGELEVIVAVRQGNILATAFHPELTTDTRWHRQEHADRYFIYEITVLVALRYFLKVVEDYKESHDKK